MRFLIKLKKNKGGASFAPEVIDRCHAVEAVGWTFHLSGMPSHIGQIVDDRADPLTMEAEQDAALLFLSTYFHDLPPYHPSCTVPSPS